MTLLTTFLQQSSFFRIYILWIYQTIFQFKDDGRGFQRTQTILIELIAANNYEGISMAQLKSP